MNESEAPDADVVIRGTDLPGPGLTFDAARGDRLVADIETALRARGRGRAILVAGACGGCGTTTIALHVAAALANRTCCVLEAHPRCGLRQRLHLPDDALDRSSGDRLSDLPVAPRFRVSLAPRSESVEDRGVAIERLLSTYEVVIVDAGAQPSDVLSAAGDVAVLTMPATAPGMLRARAWLEERADLSCATVVNRLGPGSDLTNADLRKLLQRRVSLELPCTAALRDVEDKGVLLSDRRWNRRIDQLARALVR